MSLVKIIGRDVVTSQEPRTRQVWVDDPVSPPVIPPVIPPVTPPITPPPSTPPVYVPFVGAASIPCVDASGRSGIMLIMNHADGTYTRLSSCVASDGLS